MLDRLRPPAIGSTIATAGAGPWLTDFLNAAYFARDPAQRDVDDLRLALCILTTRWARRGGRRLGTFDLPAFVRAFGAARLTDGGRLNREELLDGGARLFGDWFPGAYVDVRRRAHGVAFSTLAERRAFDPSLRQKRAPLRELTPPRAAPDAQHWATYAAVPLPDADAALRFLMNPARWPDMASDGGRFTAVRRGGLHGNTFEISVIALPLARLPLFTRGYVTCTGLHRGRRALQAAVATVTERVPDALPDGAAPVALVELTTHRGHFLGRAVSRLLVFKQHGDAFIRDVGCWDPLPPHLAAAYAAIGREAQTAFWGLEPEASSMLVQLARVTARA